MSNLIDQKSENMASLDDLDRLLIEQVNHLLRQLPKQKGRDIVKLVQCPSSDIPLLVNAVEKLLGFTLFDGNRLKRKFLVEALESLRQVPAIFDDQDAEDIKYFEMKTAAPFKDVLDLPNPTKALRLLEFKEHEAPFYHYVYLRLIHLMRSSESSEEGAQPGSSYASALHANKPAPIKPVPKAIVRKESRCPDKALCIHAECKQGHTPEERKFFAIRDRAVENGFDGSFVKTSYCIHWESNKCRRDKMCCFFAHGHTDLLCRECKTFGSCTC